MHAYKHTRYVPSYTPTYEPIMYNSKMCIYRSTGIAKVCITNLKKVSKRKLSTQNNKPKQHIPEQTKTNQYNNAQVWLACKIY